MEAEIGDLEMDLACVKLYLLTNKFHAVIELEEGGTPDEDGLKEKYLGDTSNIIQSLEDMGDKNVSI